MEKHSFENEGQVFMVNMYGINLETFFKLVDCMYDELLIYDRNYNIVYINQACCRHYSCRPEQMIGRSFFDFVYTDWWAPSILPVVFEKKRSYAIRQSTYTGAELLTIAVPIFDQDGEVEFVVMNVRDDVDEIDLYNPQYAMGQENREFENAPICESPEMQAVRKTTERVAKFNTPCIFYGETGVGKTVMAHYLHSISARADKSFVTFDCMNLPQERMIRELFGADNMPGLLYRMRDSTLLLKNISQLSLEVQARLAGYLNDEREDTDPAKRSVRLVASARQNLKSLVRLGLFREDLYYKLNVAEIYLPPLRKRRQDIRPLVYYFMNHFCKLYHTNRQLTEGAMQTLIHAEWHNNVRELRYTIERLVVMGDNPVIDVNQLPKTLFGITDSEEETEEHAEQFDERVEQFKASLIHDAYQKYGSSRRVAEHLGISQSKANNLIRKYIRE